MSDARPSCPKCFHSHVSKNGHVQAVQRWKYRNRSCGDEFTRTTPRGEPAAKKALALLLYSMGRASYGILARLLKVSRTTVSNTLPVDTAGHAQPGHVTWDGVWLRLGVS